MSYALAAFGSSASAADKATQEAVAKGEAYEKYAAAINEEAAAVVEVRDKVFKIADQLGIGQEIRTLYHTTAMAARGGAAVGTAVEVILTGSTLGAGAAAGMAAGMVVGVAVAIFSLLTDDGSEQRAAERAARNKERDAALAFALKRLDMAGLINEQKSIAAAARRRAAVAQSFNKFTAGTVLSDTFNLGDPKQYETAAQAADKLVLLYQQVQQQLKPAERELFVASANLSRWARYFMTFEVEKKKLADALSSGLPGVLAQHGVVDKSTTFYKNAQAQLNNLIAAEHEHIKVLTKPKPNFLSPGVLSAVLGMIQQKASAPIKKSGSVQIPNFSKTSPLAAIFVGGLLAAACVGGYWYWRKRHRK